MALAMSRPWKHPTTGIYWLRKRVPDDLRAAVGKREEKFSLKTREPVEAKRLHAEALAALGVDWGGTTPDGEVTVDAVYCLGLCAVSPAALVDGEPLGRADGMSLIAAARP